jgi:hypothetical protein
MTGLWLIPCQNIGELHHIFLGFVKQGLCYSVPEQMLGLWLIPCHSTLMLHRIFLSFVRSLNDQCNIY